MFARNIIQTFLSKSFMLVLNFGLIVFTSNMWGSEGRGLISLLIADLAIVGIVSDLIAGTSLSYYASRYQAKNIRPLIYSWSILSSLCFSAILSFIHAEQYYLYLAGVSVFFGLLSCNVNFFVGINDIANYNRFTALQPLGIAAGIACGLLFYNSPELYFISQIATFAILFSVSFAHVKTLDGGTEKAGFLELGLKFLKYGWQTQLSYLMQFFNYRLSYFLLAELHSIASVGVFSIGVALSEAIWMVSKSISLVLYSDTVNEHAEQTQILNTKLSIKISLYATVALSAVLLIVPSAIYGLIFGDDFSEVKIIILYLLPGIIAIGISNVIGHYFSATYQLRILNIKSLLGLIATLASATVLIPQYGIAGASISASISYLISSGVLFIAFYRKHAFRLADFSISAEEIKKVKQLIYKG